MDRRVFFEMLSATAIVAPLSAIAQTAVGMRRLGILSTDAPRTKANLDAIFAPLRDLGWVEKKTLEIELRYVNGHTELLPSNAEDLVRLRMDVIGTLGTPAALAAKAATSSIPIVLWSAGDPVGSGLVASLSKPGGNVTGFSFLTPELETKRVELLRELVPGLLRLGVLEPANHPFYRGRRSDFEKICRTLGVAPLFVEVAEQAEVEGAVTQAFRRGAQALLVPQEPVFQDPGPLMAAASKYALPTVSENPNILKLGGLAYFAHSSQEQNERFAWCVDKILRGAKPAELPIQQPTRFVLAVNAKAAKSLGLTIPTGVRLRADEVIE
jgi:putative ABC transport system substrate-binding protein